jgi:hypothetical protein
MVPEDSAEIAKLKPRWIGTNRQSSGQRICFRSQQLVCGGVTRLDEKDKPGYGPAKEREQKNNSNNPV